MRRAGGRLDSGWRVEMRTDSIDVTSGLPRRDPKWVYTDAAGHEHRAAVDPDKGWVSVSYPSLVWVSRMVWCADCRDEHDDGHYECPECGEHVVPGMKPGGLMRESIQGMMEITVTSPEGDVWPLSMAEYTELAEGGQEALDAIIERNGWRGTRRYDGG